MPAIKELAKTCEKRKEYEEACIWYIKANERGDIESLMDLGDLYKYYKWDSQSNSKALEWLTKYISYPETIAINRKVCLFRLGEIYYYGGYGVEVSYSKAFSLFNESGINISQYYMGWMYEHGQGMRKNITNAVCCYKRSNGTRDAVKRMESLEKLTKK